jgi:hypothetical protein
MALTIEERVQELETKMDLVEVLMNRIQTMLTNLATLEQLRQLTIIRQTEIDDINTAIVDLQTDVNLLKGEVFS